MNREEVKINKTRLCQNARCGKISSAIRISIEAEVKKLESRARLEVIKYSCLFGLGGVFMNEVFVGVGNAFGLVDLN